MNTCRIVTIRRTVFSFLILTALGTVVWLIGCSREPPVWGEKQPHILVSVPPLYSFAKSVAGNHGEVKCICTTDGPHSHDYTTTDVHLLRGSTCFFTVGLELDDKFSDKMLAAVPNSKHFALGDKLPSDLKLKAEHDEKEGKGKDEHEHEGEFDPHAWLGTPQAIEMVKLIRDELQRVDPANKDDYAKNAEKYIEQLKELKAYGEKELQNKKERRIISFHDSLRYFAKAFDITIIDVIEKLPGQNPESEDLINLVKKCRAEKDRVVIAVEPQYPEAAAKRLQEEVGDKVKVVTVKIDPLETAEEKDLTADLYIKTMRDNLKALAEQLR